MTTTDLVMPTLYDQLLLELPLPVRTRETFPLPSFADTELAE